MLMKSRSIGWGLLLTLLMAVLFAMPVAADYDPITTSSACVPKTLVEPGPVEVTIKVYNGGDTDMQNPMTLYDPDGNAVSTFTDVMLKAGQSQSWNGTWNVTQDQMEDEKLRFVLRYALDAAEGGDPVQVNKTIAVSIQQDAPTPKLTASYTVTPNPAQKGQEVVFTYTLSNTGNVAVTNVQITNTKLTNDKINVSRIEPGDKITREFTYTMGKKAVSFKPKVTYRAEGSDKVLTIGNMAQKTLEVAEGGLDLALSGENVTGVLPGSKAKLTLTLKNTGNITYTNLLITDSVLGEIESGLEIKPGEEKTVEKEFTVQESADHAFTVSGSSSAGGTIEYASNKVSVAALDTAKALSLEVIAQAGQTAIREKPATVAFAVTIKNTGDVDGENIAVYQGDTQVATIASLPAGEEARIVKEFDVSMEGTFQFSARYKLAVEGQTEEVEQRFDSNELMIAYIEPTPEPVTPPPTTAPVVTVEPIATPEPQEKGSVGMTILYVVAGLLVVALLAVLALILLGRRRASRPSAAVLDAFERGGSRSYTSRPGQGRRRQRQRVDLGDVAREDWGEDVELPQMQAPDAAPVEEEEAQDDTRYRRPRGDKADDTADAAPTQARGEEPEETEMATDGEQTPAFDEDDYDDEDEEAPAKRPSRVRRAPRETPDETPKKAKKGLFSGLFGKKKRDDDFIDDDFIDEDGVEAETSDEAPDMDKTVLYDRELLSKIRESAKAEGELSEQDKLLMQGGTGSYRLTRSDREALSAKKPDDEWLDGMEDGPYEDDPYEDGEHGGASKKRGRRRDPQ